MSEDKKKSSPSRRGRKKRTLAIGEVGKIRLSVMRTPHKKGSLGARRRGGSKEKVKKKYQRAIGGTGGGGGVGGGGGPIGEKEQCNSNTNPQMKKISFKTTDANRMNPLVCT